MLYTIIVALVAWRPAPAQTPASWSLSSGETFKWVPGGTFLMGTPGRNRIHRDERPQHDVTVDGLYVMESEVTQALWESVMGSNPSHFANCGDQCPVERVSWLDAVNFANRLSARENLTPAYQMDGESVTWDRTATGFRLLTEAEWEWAARGGKGYTFAGSDDVSAVAWVFTSASEGPSPRKVCLKARNDFGLCDMSGNVAEWVWDRQGPYSREAQTNPTGPSTPVSRGFRGGSWFGVANKARVSARDSAYPHIALRHIGLRLAKP